MAAATTTMAAAVTAATTTTTTPSPLVTLVPSSPLELPSPTQIFRSGAGKAATTSDYFARSRKSSPSTSTPVAERLKIKTISKKTDAKVATKRKAKAGSEREGQSCLVKSRIGKPSCSSSSVTSSAAAALDVDGLQQVRGGKENPITDGAKGKERPACLETQPNGASSSSARWHQTQPLGLDRVVSRKRDWTPVKPSAATAAESAATKENTSPCGSDNIVLDLTTDREDPSSCASAPASASRAIFSNLGGIFSYDAPPAQQRPLPLQSPTMLRVATKRRKVELVDSLACRHSTTQSLPAKKRKSTTKRKAQTITEKATEPFMPRAQETEPSLLELFCQSQSAPKERPWHPHEEVDDSRFTDGHLPPTRTEAAVTTKSKKTKPKRSKNITSRAALPLPIPSPEEALRALQHQDLLFGTSSQLVREESPTLVRDLQQALKNSQSEMPDEGDEHHFFETEATAFPTTTITTTASTRKYNTPRLWSAAARDSQGSVLDKEEQDSFVDLCSTGTTTPATGSRFAFTPTRTLWQAAPSPSKSGPALALAAGMHAKDDEKATSVNEAQASSNKDDTAALSLPPLLAQASTLPRSMAECALKERPKPKSKTKPKPKPKTASKSKATALPPPTPSTGTASLDDYTDAMLKQAVAAFGFKPSTSRKKMTAILERCWESQRQRMKGKDDEEVEVGEDAGKEAGADGKVDTRGISDIPVVKAGISGLEDAVKVVVNMASETASTSVPAPEVPAVRARGRPPGSKNKKQNANTDAATGVSGKEKGKSKASGGSSSTSTGVVPAAAGKDAATATASASTTTTTITTAATIANTNIAKKKTDDDATSPAAAAASINAAISHAISTQPPTHAARAPSFAEQIALYDPIVLEELTVWLNSAQGLGRVGVDEEVAPSVVRAWCEARSVCCVWRVNLRGKVRK